MLVESEVGGAGQPEPADGASSRSPIVRQSRDELQGEPQEQKGGTYSEDATVSHWDSLAIPTTSVMLEVSATVKTSLHGQKTTSHTCQNSCSVLAIGSSKEAFDIPLVFVQKCLFAFCTGFLSQASEKPMEDGCTIQTSLVLQESATEVHFSHPSLAVIADSEAYWNTAKRNKEYEQLTAARSHTEKYTTNHSQTINRPFKSKEISAVLPPSVTAGVAASPAEIYDAFHDCVMPRGQTVQQQWVKKAESHLDHAIELAGSLISVTKPAKRYASETLSPRKNVASQVFAAGGLRSGPTTKSRHSEVAPGSLQELTKINIRSGSTSPLHASGSTRNVPRKKPSLPKTGAPAVSTELTAPATEDASPDMRLSRKWEGALDPAQLSAKLHIMDKVLAQRRYHTQQMAYCNYSQIAHSRGTPETGKVNPQICYPHTGVSARPCSPCDSDASSTATDEDCSGRRDAALANPTHFEKVFCFNGGRLTSNTEVSCLEWSPGCGDLLAVGHGRAQAPVDSVGAAGHILFWSIQNPVYPERVIRTGSGVLCLNFSELNPNLIAAGMVDGHLALWDLRKEDEQPVLQSDRLLSSRGAARHSDAVWDVRWVDKGPEALAREEILSIAGDGTVNQWSLKKGLEKKVLMSIKRVSNPFLQATQSINHDDHKLDSVAFRYAAGLCIDVSQQNPSTYLIGTDEGLIHRCSTSYNEQYVDTYLGHTAPVTKVRYNPFDSGFFLSSSDDGTMRLWCTARTNSAVAVLRSSTSFASVTDLSWCPTISTAFAACTDEHVEFWDLARQQAEPVARHSLGPLSTLRSSSLSSVRFSSKGNALAVGDHEGSTAVLCLKGTHQEYSSIVEQRELLRSSVSRRMRPLSPDLSQPRCIQLEPYGSRSTRHIPHWQSCCSPPSCDALYCRCVATNILEKFSPL